MPMVTPVGLGSVPWKVRYRTCHGNELRTGTLSRISAPFSAHISPFSHVPTLARRVANRDGKDERRGQRRRSAVNSHCEIPSLCIVKTGACTTPFPRRVRLPSMNDVSNFGIMVRLGWRRPRPADMPTGVPVVPDP